MSKSLLRQQSQPPNELPITCQNKDKLLEDEEEEFIKKESQKNEAIKQEQPENDQRRTQELEILSPTAKVKRVKLISRHSKLHKAGKERSAKESTIKRRRRAYKLVTGTPGPSIFSELSIMPREIDPISQNIDPNESFSSQLYFSGELTID